MDEHRAVRIRSAVLADRADHHAKELAVPAVSDHEQIGGLRRLHEDGRGMTLYHPPADGNLGVRGSQWR
jgi:hypothetical protein